MQETEKNQIPKQASDSGILAWFFRITLKINISVTLLHLFVLLPERMCY